MYNIIYMHNDYTENGKKGNKHHDKNFFGDIQ